MQNISIDIDCIDPAYAPGTGTPEPGGLYSREMFQKTTIERRRKCITTCLL